MGNKRLLFPELLVISLAASFLKAYKSMMFLIMLCRYHFKGILQMGCVLDKGADDTYVYTKKEEGSKRDW
jgi:hypothetical protein